MLQRLAGSAFPSVQYRICKLDQFLNRLEGHLYALTVDVIFDSLKKVILCLDPANYLRVRILNYFLSRNAIGYHETTACLISHGFRVLKLISQGIDERPEALEKFLFRGVLYFFLNDSVRLRRRQTKSAKKLLRLCIRLQNIRFEIVFSKSAKDE